MTLPNGDAYADGRHDMLTMQRGSSMPRKSGAEPDQPQPQRSHRGRGDLWERLADLVARFGGRGRHHPFCHCACGLSSTNVALHTGRGIVSIHSSEPVFCRCGCDSGSGDHDEPEPPGREGPCAERLDSSEPARRTEIQLLSHQMSSLMGKMEEVVPRRESRSKNQTSQRPSELSLDESEWE